MTDDEAEARCHAEEENERDEVRMYHEEIQGMLTLRKDSEWEYAYAVLVRNKHTGQLGMFDWNGVKALPTPGVV